MAAGDRAPSQVVLTGDLVDTVRPGDELRLDFRMALALRDPGECQARINKPWLIVVNSG